MNNPDRRADLGSLAEALVALMGVFNKGRAVLLQEAADGVEWPAHVLLRRLNGLGPTRASSVAECLHLDKSTVSRQVAALVRDGLLERHADPADGRASILVPTEAGQAVIVHHEQRRLEFFDQMLADWNDEELAGFQQLLARFAGDYAHAYDDWIAERGGHAAAAVPLHQNEGIPR